MNELKLKSLTKEYNRSFYNNTMLFFMLQSGTANIQIGEIYKTKEYILNDYNVANEEELFSYLLELKETKELIKWLTEKKVKCEFKITDDIMGNKCIMGILENCG